MTSSANLPMDQVPAHPTGPRTNRLRVVLLSVLTALSVVLWLGALWLLVFSLPRSQRFFTDFKLKVPLMTEMVFQTPRWAVAIFILVSLIVCFVVRSKWAWCWFLLVLPLILSGILFVSIYFPGIALMRGLGRGDAAVWNLFWG